MRAGITESSTDLLELVRMWSKPNNMAVNNPIFGSSCKSSKVASALNCWATTPATYNALTTIGRVLLCSPDWTEFCNEEWASLELTEIDLAQYFFR